jgi:catechol 2,3-dioxygenase-like lactoylglutathione lyase family enzyme
MSGTPMIDHLSIQVRDVAAATSFYDTVLTPLGYRRVMDLGDAVGYGDSFPAFWVGKAETEADHPAMPPHLAFSAPDRAAVVAFFEAAVAAGAEVLHEPRLWPEYHANYFAAFVRDPDANNVEACCHRPG